MKKYLLAGMMLALFLVPPVFAADSLADDMPQSKAQSSNFYEFDKSHTHILFFIDHLGFSKMVGQFTDYSGGFTFDPDNVEASKVDITFKTGSVDTNVPALDEHLRKPGFFNIEKFPEAHFVSTRIEKTGPKTGILYGDFTLLGVTKPITLDVTLNKAGLHPMTQKPAAGFEAKGKIFRSAFNMTEGLPMVGDEVTLLIEAEAGVPATKKTN